jgi:hypothetical protein
MAIDAVHATAAIRQEAAAAHQNEVAAHQNEAAASGQQRVPIAANQQSPVPQDQVTISPAAQAK